MKPPKNFYNAVDRRKLDISDNLLPDVTTSDAGKVLKVSDAGAWQLADDGGAQTMTVEITYDSEQEEYSADKTHAEIIAAIAAGVIVTATYNNRTFVYAGKNQPSAFDAVYFSYLQADSESQFIGKIIEIDEDDRIVFSEHDLNNDKVLPAVTSADYEKILQVDDQGNWGAALDRFHVGDTYEIPHQLQVLTKCTNPSNGYFMVTIPLPKYVDDNVKWFEFTGSSAKISMNKIDGTNLSSSSGQIPINDAFNLVNQITQIANDYIAIIAQIDPNSGISLATLSNNEMFNIQFNSCWIRFLDTKPST